MTRRLPLRDDHIAFHELRNYQNSMANAFGFLYAERLEATPAGGLDALRGVITKQCAQASKAGARYLSLLQDKYASDEEIREAHGAFRDATQTLVVQMDTLKGTTHTAEREDAGTTFIFHFFDQNGKAAQAQIMVTTNTQDIYKGLSDLRNRVWQKALQDDFSRLDDSIGKQYLPRGGVAAAAAV